MSPALTPMVMPATIATVVAVAAVRQLLLAMRWLPGDVQPRARLLTVHVKR